MIKEKDIIKALYPKLFNMARSELPSTPKLSRFRIIGFNGLTYESIKFTAKAAYTIAGRKQIESLSCTYDGVHLNFNYENS